MKENKNQKQNASNNLVRYLLLFFGTFFVMLGIIGIILPLLPTTPFLLLAAACYARSSKKAYNWLLNNKWFGTYIKNYNEGKGIPIKVKIMAISFLWITILASIFFIIEIFWVEILLLIIASLVSIHIVLIKTYKHHT